MADDMSLNSVQIEYLSMIQGNISRMATASALFKGFAATVLAGVVTIAFRDINPIVLLLMLLPLLAFLMLDVYYLTLERKYRQLYKEVLAGIHEPDFSMDISGIDKKEARATIAQCLQSLSISLFYAPVFLAFIVLVALRFCGIG